MDRNILQSGKSHNPAFFAKGTEVSGRFKGSYCSATVQHVHLKLIVQVQIEERSIGAYTASHEQIVGEIGLGAKVKVKHPSCNFLLKAVVTQVIDSSEYTVVFDDGESSLLPRSKVKVQGEKYFKKGMTLNTIPMINPSKFANPVSIMEMRNLSTTESAPRETFDATTDNRRHNRTSNSALSIPTSKQNVLESVRASSSQGTSQDKTVGRLYELTNNSKLPKASYKKMKKLEKLDSDDGMQNPQIDSTAGLPNPVLGSDLGMPNPELDSGLGMPIPELELDCYNPRSLQIFAEHGSSDTQTWPLDAKEAEAPTRALGSYLNAESEQQLVAQQSVMLESIDANVCEEQVDTELHANQNGESPATAATMELRTDEEPPKKVPILKLTVEQVAHMKVRTQVNFLPDLFISDSHERCDIVIACMNRMRVQYRETVRNVAGLDRWIERNRRKKMRKMRRARESGSRQ